MADTTKDTEAEWTTVVRHKSRSQKKSLYTTKQLSILERVQQGSLDPEDAARMFNSASHPHGHPHGHPHYSYPTRGSHTHGFQKRPYISKPTFSVTRGGSIALHGFHKRPLVLYANKWADLKTFLNSGEMETFMEEHKSELRKPNTAPRTWSDTVASEEPSTAIPDLTEPSSAPSSAKDPHSDKPFLRGDA